MRNSILRKILPSLLIVLFLFQGVAGLVLAQGGEEEGAGNVAPPPYSYEIAPIEINSYREAVQDCANPSLECLVHQVTRFVAIEWINDIKGDSKTPGNGGAYNPGFINGMAQMTGAFYLEQPASSKTYVADVMNSANIATPAYAQGLGFFALDPILELWKTFRNIAYVFFIVVFIVIGFMIMFRHKINGQTVVTAQQAIPSVIVSLILVTFSYAIAGFMIDLMYLSMYLIIGIFSDTLAGRTEIIGWDILKLGGELVGAVGDFGNNRYIAESFISGLSSASDGAAGTIGGFLGGLTLTLVLSVAMLIGVFRLFFNLLKAYATIVLKVVFAPMELMIGAIPGKNPFNNWIRTIVGNLAVFPTVLLVVVLYYQFTDQASRDVGGFLPPFMLGSGQGQTITAVMGLAIILALPEIVNHVKEQIAPASGIGEKIAGWAQGRSKEAMPLGLRGTGALVGGGAYGAYHGGKMGLKQAGKGFKHGVQEGLAGGSWWNAPKRAITGGISGAATGGLRGVREGIGLGVEGADIASRRVGANQPDYLNPVTNLFDRVGLNKEQRERVRKRQEGEDFLDMLRDMKDNKK